MSFLARGLSNLIGIVAPVIQSFKVLKKPTKPKLIECLHFWTIYGTFLITDWFLNTFFISCFIPFYDFFSLCFVILLSFPHIGFASMLYTKFLAPFLRKYERRIDKVTQTVMDKLWEKLPSVAMTVPVVLASIVSAVNFPMTEVSQLQIEELEDETDVIHCPASRPISRNSKTPRLQVSNEIQEEEEIIIETLREVKREVVDEDYDDFVQPPPPQPQPLRRIPQPRVRRNLRSNSVL